MQRPDLKFSVIASRAKQSLIILDYLVVLLLSMTASSAMAAVLTSPTADAPDGGIDLPLTVSIDPQWKAGLLVVGAGLDSHDPVAVGLQTLYGKVGIGIGFERAPVSTLEIGTENGSDGIITATDFCFTAGGCISTGGGGGSVGGSGTSNFLAKWITDTTLGDSPIYAGDTGVGIGTFSDTDIPDALLHLDDSGVPPLDQAMLKITRDQALTPVAGADRRNAGLYILTRDMPMNVDVYDSNASGGIRPAFTITKDGYVGINNVNPIAPLDVDGTIVSNNLFLSRGGWSITDLFDPNAPSKATGLGEWLHIESVTGGGLDITQLYVNGPNPSTFNSNINVTAGHDVIADRFCFQSDPSKCVTINNSQSAVTSVAPAIGETAIRANPTTGDVKLSIDTNSLVSVINNTNIFQNTANDPNNPGVHDFVCDPGYALNTINGDGDFDPIRDCEPVGGAGSSFGPPATAGSLTKFKTPTNIVDSAVKEVDVPVRTSSSPDNDVLQQNIRIGVDGPCDRLDPYSPCNRLDVSNPALSDGGISATGRIGVQGASNSVDAGEIGVYGQDSLVFGAIQGKGVYGKSITYQGSGVEGYADGDGGSGGLFSLGSNSVDGYALQTKQGPVLFGGRVGIDASSDPNRADWPSAEAPVGDGNPLKLLVGGSVGAKYYCDENGQNCLRNTPASTNFWTLDPVTKGIYNNNNTFNGVVAVGRPVANISTFNKLDVFTNNNELTAIKGESSTNGGNGVFGRSSGDGHGVEGQVTGASGGVAGYFSASNPLSNWALYTNNGMVQLGHSNPDDYGIVGVGIAPADWPTDATRKSVQLAVHTTVGAAFYCDEDGRNCLEQRNSGNEYWNLNNTTGDIYNNNSPDKVGIGTDVPSYDLDIRKLPGLTDGGLWPQQICLRHEYGSAFLNTPSDGVYYMYDSSIPNTAQHFYDPKGDYEYFNGYSGQLSVHLSSGGQYAYNWTTDGSEHLLPSYVYQPSPDANGWECVGSWQEFRYIITTSPSDH